MITNEHAIRELTTLRDMIQGFYDKLKRSKRRDRPSERAMSLAHHQVRIEALNLAITALTEGADHDNQKAN